MSMGKSEAFAVSASAEKMMNLDKVEWSWRDVRLVDGEGKVIFEQRVEAPTHWSDRAVTIVASKYFRGHLGEEGREDSVRTLVDRVVCTIASWAIEDGYLDLAGGRRFETELRDLVLDQALAFNTPVWLNVGVDDVPQCSACYISSVDDRLGDIMDFAKAEAQIFQRGGGSGANLSRLRAENEPLSKGGTASGPVSFMRGLDAFAGVIKSGGRMRRAAKMVVLDVDHPDVLKFIRSKAEEERRAHALTAAGYGGGIDADAVRSVSFQNANHSVRVSNAFMEAVSRGTRWDLIARVSGEVAETVDARELFEEICEAAWACGDPGLQFEDHINDWHTSPGGGPINASNPCSEFVFLDDSACNLASLNLRRFQLPDGTLDVERLRAAVDVSILAQEVIVDRASYPTEAIAANSRRYRPLGLGYANLGGFLMAAGLPYDSPEGRSVAARITAEMSARAWRQSARIAENRGAYEGYDGEHVLPVLQRHVEAAAMLPTSTRRAWEDALEHVVRHGVRNAQLTLLAPTGTIAFMMDCCTTGIEPAVALVSRKHLVGGGVLDLTLPAFEEGLSALGLCEAEIDAVKGHLREHGTLDGALRHPFDVSVFACALGDNAVSVEGHLRMMAAVQPFLSGAISKTVNMPASSTVEDVADAYQMAWELGLKAIAIYRDGSKAYQPVEAAKADEVDGEDEPGTPPSAVAARLEALPPGAVTSTREKLPTDAASHRHKFDVGGIEGYVHVGLYDDGRVGEVFVRMSKEGSALSGSMDAIATAVSIGLQYGVPLETFVDKFSDWRFEPSGWSGNPEIGHANSVVDYVFRWLGLRYPGGRVQASVPSLAPESPAAIYATVRRGGPSAADGPPCPACQTPMARNGSCHVCPACGTTSGCS